MKTGHVRHRAGRVPVVISAVVSVHSIPSRRHIHTSSSDEVVMIAVHWSVTLAVWEGSHALAYITTRSIQSPGATSDRAYSSGTYLCARRPPDMGTVVVHGPCPSPPVRTTRDAARPTGWPPTQTQGRRPPAAAAAPSPSQRTPPRGCRQTTRWKTKTSPRRHFGPGSRR